MSVGLQDPGSDGQKRPRTAEKDREDPYPAGSEQGKTSLRRSGVQTDLQLPEGEAHRRCWSVFTHNRKHTKTNPKLKSHPKIWFPHIISISTSFIIILTLFLLLSLLVT